MPAISRDDDHLKFLKGGVFQQVRSRLDAPDDPAEIPERASRACLERCGIEAGIRKRRCVDAAERDETGALFEIPSGVSQGIAAEEGDELPAAVAFLVE